MKNKDERYQRNKQSITAEDQIKLQNARVCILGCGGLGGYIIELLSRIGIGHLTVVDGDCFDETNLNRQLLSTMSTLGKRKALSAKLRVEQINPETSVTAIDTFITEENALELLANHTLIVDALDSIEARLMVSRQCRDLQIPYIYGAIAGWYGQVATILPGDLTLEKIYKGNSVKGKEKELGNPSFAPALVASIEVSEVVKLITNKGTLLRNKFLFINLLEHEYEVFEL
jgi:molybdopterin-synthase adenylyltransferase